MNAPAVSSFQLGCGHNQGNSWSDEQSAWQAASAVEAKVGHPISVRRCDICHRWGVHIVWVPR